MSPPYLGVTNIMLDCSVLNILILYILQTWLIMLRQVHCTQMGCHHNARHYLLGSDYTFQPSHVLLWLTIHTGGYSNCVGTLVLFISWPGLGKPTGVCQASVHNSSHRSATYASVYLMGDCFISQGRQLCDVAYVYKGKPSPQFSSFNSFVQHSEKTNTVLWTP